jgi:hypothetical protein
VEEMTRGPLTFKGTDLKRAINITREAGLQIARVEITKTGNILVHVGEPANDNAAQLDEWDKALGHEGN